MAECKAIDVIALHSYASSGSVSATALDTQLSAYSQTLRSAGAKGSKARLILQEWGAASKDGNRTRQAEIFSAQVRLYGACTWGVGCAVFLSFCAYLMLDIALGRAGTGGGKARGAANLLGVAAGKSPNTCLRLWHLSSSASTYALRHTDCVANCTLSSHTGCRLANHFGGLA